MIGAFSFGSGKPATAARTLDGGTETAPGMAPSAAVDAGRASTSTCGICLSIHASFRCGAAITPMFFSSHSG